MGITKSDASSLERAAFSVPEFCVRNSISLSAYRRLRTLGLTPVEMRLGLNLVRITAEAERDWQQKMQEPRPDLEIRAAERAAKAGEAAIKSPNHISKRAPRKQTQKRRSTA